MMSEDKTVIIVTIPIVFLLEHTIPDVIDQTLKAQQQEEEPWLQAALTVSQPHDCMADADTFRSVNPLPMDYWVLRLDQRGACTVYTKLPACLQKMCCLRVPSVPQEVILLRD